jgi:uncharacterized protein YndB with AHSA1/START domain
MAKRNSSNELKLTRVFDAPVQAVWDAWNDPAQAAHWWGPRGFTLTTHSKDLRPGGQWIYTMHGPDGKDYPNITTYHEVKHLKTLVYDHGATKDAPPLFRVTVYFSESGGKTTMDMTMALATAEAAERTAEFIKKANGNSTWDRLAEYVEKERSGKDVFVINRVFDIPVERMSTMWTDPKHFSQWLPPTGMEMEILGGDIKVGSRMRWSMSSPHLTLFGHFEYTEIQRPERIVYTQQFLDENGKISRHPYAPLWPETMRTTVELTAEDAESTRVRVLLEPFGTTTKEEVAAFLDARGGMMQGWTGSFDKLEEILASSALSTAS